MFARLHSGHLCLVALLVLGITSAQGTTFYEHNEIVVVEVESVPPGDNWVKRSGDYHLKGSSYPIAGYTGEGCYQFMGNSESSGPVNGIMDYKVHIQNPGTYQLYMRVMEAPLESGAGDVGNDCYVKMSGQDGCEGSFTKYVRLGDSYVWTWGASLECSHHSFSDATYELSAGTHTFQIAGRSKYFLIDRFVLATNSVPTPTDIGYPESPTDPNVTPIPLTVYDLDATSFPYAEAGYIKQGLWIALNPDQQTEGEVSQPFPHASGMYAVTLYAVAEETGRSEYELSVGDEALGTFSPPLASKPIEIGPNTTAHWDSVTIDNGERITVRSTSQAGTRAAWVKLSFRALFDVSQVGAIHRIQPNTVRLPLQVSAVRAFTLDGRRAVGASGIRVLRSGVSEARLVPPQVLR